MLVTLVINIIRLISLKYTLQYVVKNIHILRTFGDATATVYTVYADRALTTTMTTVWCGARTLLHFSASVGNGKVSKVSVLKLLLSDMSCSAYRRRRSDILIL